MSVCEAVNEILGPELIKLMQSFQDVREKVSKLDNCIDGTHIPGKRPLTDSQDDFNYKLYFPLNVHATCDSQGSFMDVEC